MLPLNKEQVREAAMNRLIQQMNEDLILGTRGFHCPYSKEAWEVVSEVAAKFAKKWTTSLVLVDNEITLTLS